jgi:predicted HicB family RNase H-like nuclease
MPSKKPMIALRLEQELHDRVVQIARAQGRSPGNWVAQKLREALGKVATYERAPAASEGIQ